MTVINLNDTIFHFIPSTILSIKSSIVRKILLVVQNGTEKKQQLNDISCYTQQMIYRFWNYSLSLIFLCDRIFFTRVLELT